MKKFNKNHLSAKNLQRQLFFDVLKSIEEQNLGTDFLLDLLNVKKTSLYDRINGKKLVSIGEVNLLLERFDLNPKQYFNTKSSSIEVQFPSLHANIETTEDFVRRILRRLIEIAQLPTVKMYYISSEIPVFNYFRYKELAFFKLFIYGKTIWEIPDLKKRKFDLSDSKEDMNNLFEQINNIYVNIPSSEVWSTHLIDNTLSQIKYYAQNGYFMHKSDALLLLDTLRNLLDDLENAAGNSQKTFLNGNKGASFSLYHNEITHTNNAILIKSENRKAVFATYDNPNYFESQNEDFWDYSFKWFNKLKKKSHPLHNESERNRLMLFNSCRKKIDRTTQIIELLI